MSSTPYLAFASGAITYDCQPCGRCCRSMGLATDLVQLKASQPIRSLHAFVASEQPQGPLVSFFTYRDGCRHLGDDTLCDLHRRGGPQAKPKICRLFPFAKLVDVGGMWTLLPHPDCPWQARGTVPSPLSEHETIAAELDDAFLAAAAPPPLAPQTPLAATKRRQLEQALRDGLDLDAPLLDVHAHIAAVQSTRAGPIAPPPPLELWLDLLRCAGAPPPLSPRTTRLFIAAVPALRIALVEHMPLRHLPTALRAFEVWLRSLAELGQHAFGGDDLLALLDHAIPLLRVLSRAAEPLPELPHEPPAGASPTVAALWPDLADRAGEPLGESLLRILQPLERGAVPATAAFGRLL